MYGNNCRAIKKAVKEFKLYLQYTNHYKKILYQKISQHLENFKCVALLGPRQTGKSTFPKIILKVNPNSIDLDFEDPVDFAKLNDPSSFLDANKDKLICLDEIQRYPDLFPVLRGYLDRGERNGQMLAHLNGQLLNKRKLGSSLGVSANTIQKYLDILEGTYIIRQLRPFHTYTKKRLIKSPYISGIQACCINY